MVMVRRGIERRGRVALGADSVAWSAELLCVGIVAVRAGDTRSVHAALQERGVGVNLIALLSIGVIEVRLKQCGTERVEKLLSFIRELLSPGMANSARFDFLVGLAGL